MTTIEFYNQMAVHGFDPGYIEADEKIHRFSTNGKRHDKAGWYVCYLDPLSGAFGDWRQGTKFTWSAVSESSMTVSERQAFRAKMKQAREQRKRAQADAQAKATQKARNIWKKAKPASPEHPYLKRKGLKPLGDIRHYGKALVIPLRSLDGKLHSLQFLRPDGSKRFLADGQISGCCNWIKGGQGKTLVCEGWATGASLHMATGFNVVICFNAGNLGLVVEALLDAKPGIELVMCGDDDAFNPVNVGIEKAQAVAREHGLKMGIPQFKDVSGRPTDFNDLHHLEGLEEVRRQVEGATVPGADDSTEMAKKLFPRGAFPWEVLPSSIADSLKQLARSCASSPTSLPGAAVSIFASVIGSIVDVSPKQSWTEPLIFWFGDIRPSGAGKTPAARSLCRPLYEAQARADTRYKLELEAWEGQPKMLRGEPPERARGYFVTDLTLEGLREDHSGHGGKVCILDELSAFLSSQNQYKKKGSDRESWLCLHDGKPARIVRAGKSMTLSGARISIFGGIQPGIWRKAFSGQDGEIYLIDGTIFRFIPTYEGGAFYPLTAEAWSDENRKEWESLLWSALQWADDVQAAKKRRVLCLSKDAQQTFLDWRNELVQMQDDLPRPVRGFIPKLVGYALRFAGVLYLMDVFNRDQEPGAFLQVDDIKKGVKIAEFHLGHIIAAMEALTSEETPEVFEITEQVIHLAKTLVAMKSEVDSGWLAVGYVRERYNGNCQQEQTVKSARAMGSLLRRCGLTITGGVHDANKRRAAKCVVWDKKTESFIETSLQSLQSLHTQEYSGFWDADIEKMKSAMSASNGEDRENLQTLQTLKNQCLQTETGIDSGFADIADIADIISDYNEVVF